MVNKMKQQIQKISDDDYRKLEAVSNSYLVQFDRSPEHAGIKIEPTPAMKAGTLFHSFILEPDDFYKKYVLTPEGMPKDKRIKGYKTIVENNPDKEVIFHVDYLQLKQARKNVCSFDLEGKTLGTYLAESQKEISITWQINEVWSKGKLDALYEDDSQVIIFDLKKTQDCTQFQKSVNNFKYYRQAAMYLDGIENICGTDKKIRFLFIAVEEESPNGVKVLELDEEYRNQGFRELLLSIFNYTNWDGSPKLYENTIELLTKPAWLGG